jgi:predicted transcriptional regulator
MSTPVLTALLKTLTFVEQQYHYYNDDSNRPVVTGMYNSIEELESDHRVEMKEFETRREVYTELYEMMKPQQ